MRQRLGVLVGIIACFLILMTGFGCSSGGSNGTPLSSDKAITAFSFAAAENPLLVADLTGVIDEAQGTIMLAGPIDMAETAGLKASFATTGAQVSVGGVVQESGVTANDFAAPITYTVTAEDGSTNDYTVYVASWVHPSDLTDNISPDGHNTWAPQVVMDRNGNAIIVWQQRDGSHLQIFKSEYRNGIWTHPASLSDNISPDNQDAWDNPNVSIDNNGNAIIVWMQSDGSNDQIFKSEYRNGSWTHPASLSDNISPDNQGASDYPQVVMDDNGNAVIVWQQYDGSNSQIFKSEYRNGAWTHPAGLSDHISPGGQSAHSPHLAIDDRGDVIIAWVQSDGSHDQIFKSEYRNGTWTHPANPSDNISPDGQDAWAPSAVAMDDNGNAIIVWRQHDGNTDQIFKSEYRSGAWSHPVGLSDNISPDHAAVSPQVAMDDKGSAIIVWEQNNGSYYQISKSEYRNGGWTHPVNLSDRISPENLGAYYPQVAMDDNGNAVIVWRQSDGNNDQIFKSEYRSGAWSHPVSLSDNISRDGPNVDFPQLAMDDNSNAIIVWLQSDGNNYQTFKSEYRFWE